MTGLDNNLCAGKLYANKGMSAFAKYYPSAEDNIVPWNARYQYPGQAVPATKTTPRIAPKNGSTFQQNQIIRLEFPAQGYINPRNTTLAFDVALNRGDAAGGTNFVRFQNNIQSIFQRVRLMYGSTPLEDIIDYNVITRCLTEWTAQPGGHADQLSINDGIGNITYGAAADGVGVSNSQTVHARQFFIHGHDNRAAGAADNAAPNVPTASGTFGGASGTYPTRRYTVQLGLGLFNQDKLLPVKFMASQLAIEITLASNVSCLFSPGVTNAAYEVQNVTLLPEILEFDAAYDAMFLKGLRDGGVPIKFQTWHNFQFNIQAATSVNVQIQERARSVKSIFAVQRIGPDSMSSDSGATLYSSSLGNTLQQFQFRIGGRYYPAAPVKCNVDAGTGNLSNGAGEAYVELAKALHTLGDYRLSTALNTVRWGYPVVSTGVLTDAAYDGYYGLSGITGNGFAVNTGAATSINLNAGMFSQAFAMAQSLETTDGGEISGLNAEEQSDIILSANWSGAQVAGHLLEVFTYFDCLLILRENNVVELVQ